MSKAIQVVLLALLLSLPAGAQSRLSLNTPDTELSAAFEWAQAQALNYVSQGGDPVGRWYEAALPSREAFCMRDVSHQSMGAHALGLHAQNRNMFEKFAANISESKDWCSYWEINRHNLPAPVDYRNDNDFWYNLPANFDVLDACFRMYLWSGNREYLQLPVFQNFYSRTLNAYIPRWDLQLDRIMNRPRIMNARAPGDSENRFARSRGIPSYEEGRSDFRVAADLIAAQIAAYVAYSRMQMLQGHRDEADRFKQHAANTRAFLNTTWWDGANNQYYSFVNTQDKLMPGSMAAWVLYFGASEQRRTAPALDAVLRRIQERPINIESQSHLPEILYRYGRNQAAYEQLLDLSRPGKPRREYPEVSYSVIGAIVNGLMGIEVDPARIQPDTEWNPTSDGVVTTIPRLTARTESADLRHLPVRGNDISVRHDGTRKTTLTNMSGPLVKWQACFPGATERLVTNGRAAKAQVQGAYGPEGKMSCTTVNVPPGKAITVAYR